MSPKQLNENQEAYVIGIDEKLGLKKLSYANGAVMLFNKKKDFKKLVILMKKFFFILKSLTISFVAKKKEETFIS